ncbi:MAG: magnesium transporter [Phycisphaerales bacterium]
MTHAGHDAMVADLLTPEIGEMIAQKRLAEARAAMLDLQDVEIADVLAELEPDQRAVAFRLLSVDRRAEVFAYLEQDEQETLIEALTSEQVSLLINEMDDDDRVQFFEDAPEQLTAGLLKLMSPEQRRLTQQALQYPEESVGRLMTRNYVTVHPDWTAGQALDHIRAEGQDAETLSVLYVVDAENHLTHYLRLKRLVLAAPGERCEKLCEGPVVSLNAGEDREAAVRLMERYDMPVLPVVDEAIRLLGIVTFDDVADVAEEEVTEDMQKMGGMEALDMPYMSTGLWELFRKRGLWLSMLFLGEMLTATALGYFQPEIEKVTVLALFLPLIISSGGNSGSQASTLIIRAMAIGELTLKLWGRVFLRELTCGLLLGLLLGLIGLARIHLWQYLGWYDYTIHHGDTTLSYHLLAITVSLSLVGVVLWGTLMGSMLPFLLRLFRLDPATISAPLVATLVDVTGLIIYFTTALVFLRAVLG